MKISIKKWFESGSPWVWIYGSAVAISIIMVTGLLLLIGVRGLGHFWPSDVLQAQYQNQIAQSARLALDKSLISTWSCQCPWFRYKKVTSCSIHLSFEWRHWIWHQSRWLRSEPHWSVLLFSPLHLACSLGSNALARILCLLLSPFFAFLLIMRTSISQFWLESASVRWSWDHI